jgi:hypothetical protein
MSDGVANPLDIKTKELELDSKHDLETTFNSSDGDHIYDDPSHLMQTCLKMPLPSTGYNILSREIDGKEKSCVSTPTPYSEPSTGAKVPGGTDYSGRYSNMQLSSVGGTQKPKQVTPVPLPPGYSAPKSLASAAAPVPPGYAVPGPQSMAESDAQPLTPEKVDPVDGETVQYFPLMRRKRENSTYQAVIKPTSTASPAQQNAPMIEEEQYIKMETPDTRSPTFPE